MLITKFNKMIRNRMLWAVFAVIVSISFIGFFSPKSGRDKDDNDNRGAEGIIYGEKITNDEFTKARFFEMGMDMSAELSPEERKYIRKSTWKRILVLRTAEKMGIYTTDEEIKSAIRKDPTFAENGVFNEQKYRQGIHSYLRGIRDPEAIYWEYQKEDIIIRKVIAMLDALVWISPFELESRLHNVLDKFVVEYASVDFSDHAKPAKITSEDIEAFYEANKSDFKVPEKIRISYVSYPVSNFLEKAVVHEDEISDYYNEHINNYVATTNIGTNEVVSTQLLAEVSEDITSELKFHAATFLAKTEANDFVDKLAGSETVDLVKTASDNGLAVSTSAMFSVGSEIPGIEASYEFHLAAFRLDPSDPDKNFSDPILGGDNVYVISVTDKQDSYIPELSTVTNEVVPLAISNAVLEAFIKKTDDIRDSVEKNIGSDTSFASAMSEFNLNVATTEPFTVREGISSNDPAYLEAILPHISLLNSGQMTESVKTDDGAVLAYISERTASDFASMQWYGSRLSGYLGYHRIGMLYEDWSDYLLAQAKFEDYHPLPEVSE